MKKRWLLAGLLLMFLSKGGTTLYMLTSLIWVKWIVFLLVLLCLRLIIKEYLLPSIKKGMK